MLPSLLVQRRGTDTRDTHSQREGRARAPREGLHIEGELNLANPGSGASGHQTCESQSSLSLGLVIGKWSLLPIPPLGPTWWGGMEESVLLSTGTTISNFQRGKRHSAKDLVNKATCRWGSSLNFLETNPSLPFYLKINGWYSVIQIALKKIRMRIGWESQLCKMTRAGSVLPSPAHYHALMRRKRDSLLSRNARGCTNLGGALQLTETECEAGPGCKHSGLAAPGPCKWLQPTRMIIFSTFLYFF